MQVLGLRTFGSVAMGSAVWFILRFVYSAGSGLNRVQVHEGISVRLFCPGKNLM